MWRYQAPVRIRWRRKGRGQLDNMCRRCRSAYKREHYLANKQRYVDQARARKQILRMQRTTYLLRYFTEHPCTDCSESDPVVLEFDHLEPDAKCFNIGQSMPHRSWQTILEEIASATWCARTAIDAAPPAGRARFALC
jgi:hypothetical protein